MALTKKQELAINEVVKATELVERCKATNNEVLDNANKKFLKATSDMMKAFRM
jgi:hypothetical protein